MSFDALALLAIWLLGTNIAVLVGVINTSFVAAVIIGVIALAAGVLLVAQNSHSPWIEHLGKLLVGFALVLSGLSSLVGIDGYERQLALVLMAVGALALFWNLYKDPHNRSWGLLLTGIWLLVVALINLFSISLPPLTLALSVVGVIAGVLLLVKK